MIYALGWLYFWGAAITFGAILNESLGHSTGTAAIVAVAWPVWMPMMFATVLVRKLFSQG